MHPGTVDGQAAFAAQGVIDGEQQRTSRREHTCHEHGQTHVEKIETPGSIAEEAMKARPMPVGDIATREDDVGDEAMAMREGPPGTDLREGPEGRLGKNGDEVGYQIEEGLRKLHESASLPGDLEFFWYTQDAKKRPGSRHEFLPRTSPAESAKLELRGANRKGVLCRKIRNGNIEIRNKSEIRKTTPRLPSRFVLRISDLTLGMHGVKHDKRQRPEGEYWEPGGKCGSQVLVVAQE